MINIEGKSYYTAKEICPILDMKYSSVIYLLRKNEIEKYDNKYIISEKQLEKLKNRTNQTMKTFMVDFKEMDERNLINKKNYF